MLIFTCPSGRLSQQQSIGAELLRFGLGVGVVDARSTAVVVVVFTVVVGDVGVVVVGVVVDVVDVVDVVVVSTL